MNKGFFLFSLVSLLPFNLLATDPFAAHQPSPGQAMLGAGEQAPSFDALDMFGTFDALDMFGTQAVPEDVLIEAYEVRRGLMCQPEANKEYIATIERMIRDVSKTDDETMLKAYSFNLRRYKRLSRISMENPFSTDKHQTFCELLELREEWVKTLLQHCFKLRVAQQLLTKTTKAEEGEQSLTAKQKQKYEEEYRTMCEEELEAVKKIQRDLEPLEEELLRDDRSWGDKYGLIVGAGVTLVSLIGVVGLLGNVIQETMKPTKKGTAGAPQSE